MNERHRGQVIGLDLVRCAAALMVVFYHYIHFLPIWEPSSDYKQSWAKLVPYTWFGWAGVQVFFVISGFVIAYSANRTTASSFAKSRFLRLFPTLWICSLLTLSVRYTVGSDPHQELLHEWLRSIVLDPYTTSFIDPSYWTLPVEIVFYVLIFSLLATRTFRFISVLVSVMGLVCTASVFYELLKSTCCFTKITLVDRIIGKSGQLGPAVIYLVFSYGLFFAIGTELWLFLFERKTYIRASLLLVFLCGGVAQITNQARGFKSALRLPYGTWHVSPWPPILFWLLSVVAIICSVVFNDGFQQWLGSSASRVIRSMGLATYPLYLLHQAIGAAAMSRLHRFGHELMLAISLILVIALFCATILPKSELPLQRLLRRWLGMTRKQNELTAATLP